MAQSNVNTTSDELREQVTKLLWGGRTDVDGVMTLIKQHELQARLDELGHCCGKCGVWHSETCNISQRRLSFRERINELKQELEKL